MRKNPFVVQCKVELESTVASLRHILISPGVWKGTVPVRREGRRGPRAESVAGAQACLLTQLVQKAVCVCYVTGCSVCREAPKEPQGKAIGTFST